MTTTTVRRLVLAAVLAGALVAAGCGDDDDAASSTTTTAAKETTTTTATSAETARFDKTVQEELQAVGCYTGQVDGIMGPETDAAIVAFQRAEGLEVDGELGPQTDEALTSAAEAARSEGKKVCTASTSTTTTTKPASTTTRPSGTAPCTATAISAALGGGEQLTNYVCADGWAAGSWTNGQADGAFILQSVDGAWAKPAQDPCGSASAELPPVILSDGCAS